MQDDKWRIAFDLLYAEHAAPVYRFALRLSGCTEDAEDLAAETLSIAYRRHAGFRAEASLRTWLFSILLNQWRMSKRKKRVHQDPLDDARNVAATFDVADFDLAEAIRELPEALKEAFLLVKGEGLTHAEAAKVLRVPVGTMYFRVHAAVQQLRVKLGPSVEAKETDGVKCSHEM